MLDQMSFTRRVKSLNAHVQKQESAPVDIQTLCKIKT